MHVGQRHGFAAVLFANTLIVREVDSDRGDRTRITSFDNHLDRRGRDALHLRLAEPRSDGQMVLKPLRIGREALDLFGLVVIDVVHDAFPCAFDAPRIEVDLDKAVHRVDGRLAILHPRDVERLAIRLFARFVPTDQRAERGQPGPRVHSRRPRASVRRPARSRRRRVPRRGRPPRRSSRSARRRAS